MFIALLCEVLRAVFMPNEHHFHVNLQVNIFLLFELDQHPSYVISLCSVLVIKRQRVIVRPASGGGREDHGSTPGISLPALSMWVHNSFGVLPTPTRLGWGTLDILCETILHCTGLSLYRRTFSICDPIL